MKDTSCRYTAQGVDAWVPVWSLEPTPDETDRGVAYRRLGPVAVVTLHRPDVLNALELASWRRLDELFTEIAASDDIRVVVVRGAGRAFSAGANIGEFPERRMTAAAASSYNRTLGRALEAVMQCPVPVLAMIHGLAVGGGCELAAACDVRVCSDDSRFGIPIGKLGVTLGLTETRALVRLIGPGRLKDLVFSGRLIDAGTASSIGLVERVVSGDRLERELTELIRAIVRSAPATMRTTKLVVDTWGRPFTERDADVLIRATVEAYESADLREGVAAFLERRAPDFGPSTYEEA